MQRLKGPKRPPPPQKDARPAPSKQEILNTLEQFGDKYYSNGQVVHDNPDDSMVIIDDAPKANPADMNPGQPKLEDDFDSVSMANSYKGEWEKLFQPDGYIRQLRHFGMNGKLRSTRFRSICWKLYLEVLPENRGEWLSKTNQWRQKYTDLKQQLIINPRTAAADPLLNNPLSQETESPWNQFFQDNELRLTIKQDVIRTYPKIEFFHTDEIRTMMVDGLFIYAKLNPDVAYRQGMHELLAPLIFVLHCDHQAFLHACEMETLEEVVRELLDPEYIEHDAFAMFCAIMETVEPWYVSKEVSPTIRNNNILTALPFARPQDMNPSNVVTTKLTRIQDYILKRYDLELHGHLEKFEIAPQIYGIRWVRLLFGREFPMQDLLVMWDAIFADGIAFDLVDYIFVAMLLYIRDLLITSDYATCLTCLMKFPPVGDVHYFIQKAMYLREPNQQPRPPDYTFQRSVFPNYLPSAGNYRPAEHRRASSQSAINIAEKAANIVTGFSTLTRKLSTGSTGGHVTRRTGKHGGRRPKTLSVNDQRMSKSASEPMNLLTDESPGEQYIPHTDKRGSTASLPVLEDGPAYYGNNIKAAGSSRSLAQLETTSYRSACSSPHGSVASAPPMSPAEERSPAKYSTMPSAKRSNKKALSGRNAEYDLAIMMGRMNDMDAMCRKCADKMDIHIDKLQNEMLHQDLENEDELLLALAGLKQVRDVLKGILKPNAVFDKEEIQIQDNYYRDEQIPSSADLTPSSVTSKGYTERDPRRSLPVQYQSSMDTTETVSSTSSPDSSSPEYTENLRPDDNTVKPHQSHYQQGRTAQDGRPKQQPTPTRENKPEIELADIRTESGSKMADQHSQSGYSNGSRVQGHGTASQGHGGGRGDGVTQWVLKGIQERSAMQQVNRRRSLERQDSGESYDSNSNSSRGYFKQQQRQQQRTNKSSENTSSGRSAFSSFFR